jgi:PAS domain S-box-containing protein
MTLPRVPELVLAQIVHIASEAIICVDEAQTILFFNDGAVQLFEYQPEEILGQSLSRLMPERFHRAHGGHVSAFGRNESQARKMSERSEIFARRRSGEEFAAEAAISKVQTDSGMVFAVVLRDVSEKRRTEAVVQRSLEHAEAALRARDDLVSVVSHDLRNPANAVKMLAAALTRMPVSDTATALPVEARAHAKVMLDAANQMDTLIQDLLDFSRIERGQLRMTMRPEAIGSLVATTVDVLAPLAASREVSLETELEAGLPLVNIDPDRIAQVLSNLVGNAIKFTSAGGHVRVRAMRDGAGISVVVHDTGVGISADELPYVFDRYWQSKRTDRSGAGLGLSIANGIVQAHAGTLTLTSDEGQGTSATVTLPGVVSVP